MKVIYICIPETEYNSIVNGKERVTKAKLRKWRENYEKHIQNKKINAVKANKAKQEKTIEKIINSLKKLNTEDKKNLTPYKLSKLAKVNYRTAKKFWEKHNLDKWTNTEEKFENYFLDKETNL